MKSIRLYFQGWQAVLAGAGLLRKHPQLIRHAIWPFVLGILISLVTLSLFLFLAIWSIASLHEWFQAAENGWTQWIWSAAEIVVGLLLVAISLGVAAATWLLLYALLLGNALGKVAEETERILGADPDQFQALAFSQEAMGTLIHLGLILGISLLALPLNALPLVGSLLALLMTTYVTWLMLGLEFMSHSLSLRGETQWQQIRFARRHWQSSLGLGSAVLIGQMIPVIGTVLHLCCTVGGVILFHRLTNDSDR